MSVTEIAKRIDVKHNVSIRVLDKATGQLVSEHTGHNASTNSLLTGVGHYLTGDSIFGQQGILDNWIPQYISLGTMGLLNQDEDELGLPAGIGEDPADIDNPDDPEQAELKRYVDYMLHTPGFGADGYDPNSNNDRRYLGLGPMFIDRELLSEPVQLKVGDLDMDGEVTHADLLMLLEYLSSINTLTDKQLLVADINNDGIVDAEDAALLRDAIDSGTDLGTVTYAETVAPAINCELISDSYPRSQITFRDMVPESQSEYPKTIDVVFSAFVSTGALAQFRATGQDYIFITEAGLWARPFWTTDVDDKLPEEYWKSEDNGLLAGYRIAPPDEENWKMAAYDEETQKYVDSEEYRANRQLLKENIIKVGINQVVQVIWKIQIGGIEQLGGIEKFYPTENKVKWTVWE